MFSLVGHGACDVTWIPLAHAYSCYVSFYVYLSASLSLSLSLSPGTMSTVAVASPPPSSQFSQSTLHPSTLLTHLTPHHPLESHPPLPGRGGTVSQELHPTTVVTTVQRSMRHRVHLSLILRCVLLSLLLPLSVHLPIICIQVYVLYMHRVACMYN